MNMWRAGSPDAQITKQKAGVGAGRGGRLCGSASLVDARQLFVLTGLLFSTFSCYCSASATSLAKNKKKKEKKENPFS